MKRASAIWDRVWFSEGSLVGLGAWRVLVLLIAGYATAFPSWVIFSYTSTTGEELGFRWTPVYFIEVMGMGPPGAELARTLLTILVIAYGTALLGIFTRTSTLVVAVLGVFWWGLGYSFGQAHHEKISLAFALMTLPFCPCGARLSVDAWLARRRGRPLPQSSELATWPRRLVQVSIAFCYLFAGGSKVLISGFEWANGYTLQAIMATENDPMAQAIAGDVFLAQLASGTVLFIQGTFPLVFLHRHLRWVYVPGTVAFHLGAWITMNPGPYYTLWLLTCVTFFRVDLIPTTLRQRWLRGRRVRVALQLLALCAFGALCVWIMIRDNPPVTRYLLVGLSSAAAVALLVYTVKGGRGPAPGSRTPVS